MRLEVIAATLIFTCLGCETPGTSAARYQLGDTTVVENRVPLLPDTVVPIETHRVGRAEGPSDYLIGRITTFAVGPNGDVFVYDLGAGIRRFDRSGEFLRHVAKQGEGPDEVGTVRGMVPLENGHLVVYDHGNQRIATLTPDSATRIVRRPSGLPRYRSGTISVHHNGDLWVGVNPPHPPPPIDGVTHPRPAFVRIDPDGTLRDTLFTPANAAHDCPALSGYQYRAGFWEDQRKPFVPKTTWALGPDGTFVVGCPASYTFDVRTPAGHVTRMSRPWTPLITSDAEIAFNVKWASGINEAHPKERPAYAQFIVPGDGRIWVWPTQPSVKRELPPEVAQEFGETHSWQTGWTGSFDVFTADGDWLAVVRLPPGARYSGYPTEPDVVIRGDTIWAVALDEDDIEYVVRYEAPELSHYNPR